GAGRRAARPGRTRSRAARYARAHRAARRQLPHRLRRRLRRACRDPDDGGPMIRVAIADDQQLIRAGFRSLLEAEPGIHVVGEAATGREAVALARREKPHVLLMDIRMPDGDGLWATETIVADPQ